LAIKWIAAFLPTNRKKVKREEEKEEEIASRFIAGNNPEIQKITKKKNRRGRPLTRHYFFLFLPFFLTAFVTSNEPRIQVLIKNLDALEMTGRGPTLFF